MAARADFGGQNLDPDNPATYDPWNNPDSQFHLQGAPRLITRPTSFYDSILYIKGLNHHATSQNIQRFNGDYRLACASLSLRSFWQSSYQDSRFVAGWKIDLYKSSVYDSRAIYGTTDGINLMEEFCETVKLARCLARLKAKAETQIQKHLVRISELENQVANLQSQVANLQNQNSVDNLKSIGSVLGTEFVGRATETEIIQVLVKAYQRWAQVRYRFWWTGWRDDPFWTGILRNQAAYDAGNSTNEIVHGADLVQDYMAVHCSALVETEMAPDLQLKASAELFGITYRLTISEANTLSERSPATVGRHDADCKQFGSPWRARMEYTPRTAGYFPTKSNLSTPSYLGKHMSGVSLQPQPRRPRPLRV